MSKENLEKEIKAYLSVEKSGTKEEILEATSNFEGTGLEDVEEILNKLEYGNKLEESSGLYKVVESNWK